MGCGKSKIKKINLSPGDNAVETVSGALSGRPATAKSKSVGNGSNSVGVASAAEGELLSPKLLSAAIPVSDLGESLDSRILGESLNFRWG